MVPELPLAGVLALLNGSARSCLGSALSHLNSKSPVESVLFLLLFGKGLVRRFPAPASSGFTVFRLLAAFLLALLVHEVVVEVLLLLFVAVLVVYLILSFGLLRIHYSFRGSACLSSSFLGLCSQRSAFWLYFLLIWGSERVFGC